MSNSTEVSTACLDVTLQVNKAWVKRIAPAYAQTSKSQAVNAVEDETMLLCSDIITVDDDLRAKPQFDITSYVMEHAIAHTMRFCKNSGASIRAFRSVEVLRLMQPGLPVSFLFLFEAILASHAPLG
jgi:hypothetical protein